MEKEGVGQRESTGAAAGVPVTADHGQHQHVAHSCQDEHQGVDDGGVALRKLIDAVLCTWGCLAPACFRISVLILFIILDRKDIIIKKNTFLFSTKKNRANGKNVFVCFWKCNDFKFTAYQHDQLVPLKPAVYYLMYGFCPLVDYYLTSSSGRAFFIWSFQNGYCRHPNTFGRKVFVHFQEVEVRIKCILLQLFRNKYTLCSNKHNQLKMDSFYDSRTV